MAETPSSKRQRDQEEMVEEELGGEAFKRQKSYKDILSLLESEEDEPNEDLSSLITTLQQELSSSDPLLQITNDPDNQTTASSTVVQDYPSSSSSSSSFSCLSPVVLKEDEQEEEKERVMRHLLEASDDELGIPNNKGVGFDGDGDVEGFYGGDGFSLPEGIWELEDEEESNATSKATSNIINNRNIMVPP